MKQLFLILFCLALIGCPVIDNESDNKSDNGSSNNSILNNPEDSEIVDVVLYDGTMDDTFCQIFQQITWGFPDALIQVKFIFSDPEVFEGTVIVQTDTTRDAFVIKYLTDFETIITVNLTNSLYFMVEAEFENESQYDGRALDCKIIWLK